MPDESPQDSRIVCLGDAGDPPVGLAICGHEPDSVYLFGFDRDGVPFTDTWHESIEAARHQAEFEYEGTSTTWLSDV